MLLFSKIGFTAKFDVATTEKPHESVLARKCNACKMETVEQVQLAVGGAYYLH